MRAKHIFIAGMFADSASIREDLACALRLAHSMRFTEGVRTHFSALVGENTACVQPHDVPWSLVRAPHLISFSLSDDAKAPSGIGPSAFEVHRAMHARLGRRAGCILHAHPPYAAELSCLAPPTLEMVHQNCAYFFGKVLYVQQYDGTEGASTVLQRTLDGFAANPALRVALLANHGVTVVGETVADAFDDLFYFENAARIYLESLKTGRALRHIPADVCARVAAHRDKDRREYALRHFNTLKMELAQCAKL